VPRLTVWPAVTGAPFTVAAVTTPLALPVTVPTDRPADDSVSWAYCSGRLTTFGMATTSGPLETTTVTVAPFATSVPGAGS